MKFARSPRWEEGCGAASLAAFFRRNYSPLNSGFNAAKDIRRAVERNVLCRNLVDERSFCGARTVRKLKGFSFLSSILCHVVLFLISSSFLFEPRLRATNTGVSKGKSILAR